MKKLGRFLLCCVPMLITFALQLVIAIVMEVVSVVRYMSVYPDGDVMSYMLELASDSGYLMNVTVIFEIVSLLGFSLFYYFGMKEKHIGSPKEVFSGKSIGAIICLFAGVEIALSCALILLSVIAPDAMQAYADMIEESGLADLSVLSTLATLLLAPIAEEIIFRGITFKLARKLSPKFWVANCTQALMFGIAHGNLIQGVYAFCLGLLLGYIYRKYNSLWATILCHLTFNFAGTYLATIIFGDDEVTALRLMLAAVVAIALVVAGVTFLKNDTKVKTREELFLIRYKRESGSVSIDENDEMVVAESESGIDAPDAEAGDVAGREDGQN